MPVTARSHFQEDLVRAWSLQRRGDDLTTSEPELSIDLCRAAIVFAVAAMDAYLCDAYVDLLTRTLQVCKRDKLALPGPYAKALLPAGPMLAPHYTKHDNWAFRMAARQLMEKDNLLQISRIADLLNPALQVNGKLWHDLLGSYVALGRKRLTRHRAEHLSSVTGKALETARKQVVSAIMGRIGKIVQRRHDIAHNCDRPRYAYKKLSPGQAKAMIKDVESFILLLDDHLEMHRSH